MGNVKVHRVSRDAIRITGYALTAVLGLDVALSAAVNGDGSRAVWVASFVAGIAVAAAIAKVATRSQLTYVVRSGVAAAVVAFIVVDFIALSKGWADADCTDSSPGCAGPAWPWMAVNLLLAFVGAAALIVVVRFVSDKLAAGPRAPESVGGGGRPAG